MRDYSNPWYHKFEDVKSPSSEITSSNKRSWVNHIRSVSKKNGKSPNQYLIENVLVYNGLTVPKCGRCDGTMTLEDMCFQFMCRNEPCYSDRSGANNLGKPEYRYKNTDSGFIETIKKNIEWYANHLDQTNVVDIHTNESTGDDTLRQWLRRKGLTRNELWEKPSECVFAGCGKPFKFNALTNYGRQYCELAGSHTVTALRRGVTLDEDLRAISILAQNFDFVSPMPDGLTYKQYVHHIKRIDDKLSLSYIHTRRAIDVGRSQLHDIELIEGTYRIKPVHSRGSCEVCDQPCADFRRFCSVSCYSSALVNHESYWDDLYPENRRNRQSEMIKGRIAAGSWTPDRINSYRNERYDINGAQFRSTWECLFHLLNDNFGYEEIRVKYNTGDRERVYIVDFVDHKTKRLFEVKPGSEVYDDCVLLKHAAALEWCSANGYTYEFITESYFVDQLTPEHLSRYKEYPFLIPVIRNFLRKKPINYENL